MHETLLDILKKIRDEGPFAHDWGICGNILTKYRPGVHDMLEQLFMRWPKFSGDPAYPVPGGKDMYDEFAHFSNQWDRETEYGALRWELLEFCISELEKERKTAERERDMCNERWME